jgi:hypothetical protein
VNVYIIETSEKLPLAKPQRREDSVFMINLRLCVFARPALLGLFRSLISLFYIFSLGLGQSSRWMGRWGDKKLADLFTNLPKKEMRAL